MALIDAHQLGRGQTGNEAWIRNVVSTLAARQSAHHLAVTRRALGDLPTEWRSEHVHLVSERSSVRLAVSLPRLVRTLRPGAVLVQYTSPPFVRAPMVVLIHDLSFDDPRADEWLGRLAAERMRRSVAWSARRAEVVLAPSNWTRSEIIDRYGVDPDRVLVAANAVDVTLASLLAGTEEATPSKSWLNVLCVGTVLPRKNLTVVAKAVDALRAEGLDARLHIVGPVPPHGAQVANEISSLLGPRVSFSGHVSAADLARAYRNADVLAFPSYYEGFGIPVIEAMAASLPVVSSNATCLPEVAADAAMYADPGDLEGWISGLRLMLTDGRSRELAIVRGVDRVSAFSWQSTAEVVEQALDRASGATAARL